MSIFTQSLIDGLCLPLLRVCYPCKTFLVSLLTRDSEARLTAAFAAGRDADDAHKPYHIIMSGFEASAACAEMMDRIDPLAQFRHRFQIPTVEGRQQVYFLGNSLGLQPVTVRQQVDRILGQWSQLGVEAFFHADLPWMELPSLSYPVLSKIIGCLPTELTVMSQLTVNLHLLMASFYQPKAHRYKILCEAKAFPSDQYMMASQVRLHGYDPNQAIIEVSPPPGEHCIREQDILEAIDQHADSLALIFWGGVNYYTGQVFDMAAIAHAAHQAGARVGFDLAHAAGNIPLALHDWDVDFAAWCHYKYLNGGPGAVAGAYVHERHHAEAQTPRLNGWWGNDPQTRFEMAKAHQPSPTAEAWQVSTPSPILHACLQASLDLFAEAGWDRIQEKTLRLSQWLRFLLDQIEDKFPDKGFHCITPRQAHGCQASLLTGANGKKMFDCLTSEGIFADWREPNVIRLAPVPLYNSFSEVWRCYEVFCHFLSTAHSD